MHAPYLINVCSPRNNVRYGSRKILQQTCDAAAEVGAAAVIVHGGHADDDIAQGVGRWIRTLEMLTSEVPVYLENTAGGKNAVARRFDALARLWDGISKMKTDVEIGFCFDTCHAHAAGEDLSDAVERVRKIVGRIDLLHANDSRDPAGTGADRHANLGKGEIGADVLSAMIEAAGTARRRRDAGGRRRRCAPTSSSCERRWPSRRSPLPGGGSLTSSIVRQIQRGTTRATSWASAEVAVPSGIVARARTSARARQGLNGRPRNRRKSAWPPR